MVSLWVCQHQRATKREVVLSPVHGVYEEERQQEEHWLTGHNKNNYYDFFYATPKIISRARERTSRDES